MNTLIDDGCTQLKAGHNSLLVSIGPRSSSARYPKN